MSTLKQQIKDAERTYKSLLAILAAETAYKRASAAKKRVMIAKDVIDQIKARKLIARHGVYLMPGTLGNLGDAVPPPEGAPLDFREYMMAPSADAPCTACALGGVFACAVKFTNNVTTEDAGLKYSDDRSIKKYLKGVFEEKQLELIECAFERQHDHAHSWGSKMYQASDVQAAVEFGRKHGADSKRMIAIMKNIIKNEGKFIP